MSKIKGFYSALDKAAEALTRNKGTGKEFITELSKVKGVKPTEIQTRKLERIIEMPKMTKEQFLEKLKELPPPELRETHIGEPLDSEVRDIAERFMHEDAVEEVGMTRRNRHELEDEVDSVFEDKMENEMDRYMSLARQYIMDQGEGTKYPDYKTEGGHNYREILMRLPSDTAKNQERLYELEAKERRSSVGRNFGNITPEEVEELNQLRERIKTAPEDYKSKHWDEPNVLAHMRVQDRIVPTYTKAQIDDIGKRMAETLGVDPKSLASGAPSVAVQRGVITPLEAAQFSHAKGFKNVDTTGATQKILHVEEIQSDWHQEGRKHGYKNNKTTRNKDDIIRDIDSVVNQLRSRPDVQYSATEEDWKRNPDLLAKYDELSQEMSDVRQNDNPKAVPDAPFKKNWHELAMKRLLNYAAENGYDKIAITPGIEQVKRYPEAMRQVADEIVWDTFSPETKSLSVKKSGAPVFGAEIDKNGIVVSSSQSEAIGKSLDEILGKTMAEKAMATSGGEIKGEDFTVGGKGMQGFYDKMIPSYLNEFGKKYGTQVTPFEIEHPTANPEATDVIMQKMPLHGFDITPQMREEITTQGLPMFAEGGAVKAAVGGEYNTDPDMQDGGNVIQGTVFKKGGKVTVSNNLDTMLMDVHDKKFGAGGALKKAIKGAREILPSAEREKNLRKFLEPSAVKQRLYHGTESNIDAFRPNNLTFLTPEPKFAEQFLNEGRGTSPNIMPVYVQVKNPFDPDNSSHVSSVIKQVLKDNPNYPKEVLGGVREGDWNSIEHFDVLDAIKNLGFDSFFVNEATGAIKAKNLGVFDPKTIKSAIGNRGTYDVTNPDITKHNGGLAHIQRK